MQGGRAGKNRWKPNSQAFNRELGLYGYIRKVLVSDLNLVSN